MMSMLVQFLIGAVALVVVAVIGGTIAFWRRPIAVLTWLGRISLRLGGLKRKTVGSSIGPQVFWEAGSGTPLVLLHGVGDNAGTWAKVAPALRRSFHVVVPDLAGRGESAPLSGPISFEAVLTGIEAVLGATVSQQPIMLVGSSLGAWMAMLYTLRHREQVEHLFLVNGGGLLEVNPKVTLLPTDREQARALFNAMLHRGAASVPSCLLDDVVRRAPRSPVRRFSADDITRFRLDARLKEFDLPVDLIWGESDRLVPLDYAQRMMAGLPSARLTLLAGCAHIPHTEKPAAFISALMKCLEEPIRAGAAGAGAAGAR